MLARHANDEYDNLHSLPRLAELRCHQIRNLAWGRKPTTISYDYGSGRRRKVADDEYLEVECGDDGFHNVYLSSSTPSFLDSGAITSTIGGVGGGGGVNVSFAHEDDDDTDVDVEEEEYQNDDDDRDDTSWGRSMHLAYRVPSSGQGSFMHDPTTAATTSTLPLSSSSRTGGGGPASSSAKDSKRHPPVNALEAIHETQSRIEQLSNAIRTGKKRSAHFYGDVPLVDVLVVSGGGGTGGCGGGGVVTSAMEFVYHTLLHGSASSCAFSYVDPTSLVSSPSNAMESMPSTPDAYSGGGGGGMKKSSTLQSTAGGVLNMVTTPFKSAVQRGTGGGGGGVGGRSLSLSSSLNDGTISQSSAQHPNPRKKKLRQRKLKILSSSESSALHAALSDLDPATTIVITLNIHPDWEEECNELTSIVKTWLFSVLATSSSSSREEEDVRRREHILRHHLYTVTGRDLLPHSSSSSKSLDQNVFVLPKHSRCEAFSTFSAAGILVSEHEHHLFLRVLSSIRRTYFIRCSKLPSYHRTHIIHSLLKFLSFTHNHNRPHIHTHTNQKPLSIIFGWEMISSLLAGAHDIDRHFVDASPQHNLPVMLALVDFWNDAFLNSKGRVVSSCLGAMGLYPKCVAVLESTVLSNASSTSSPSSKSLPILGKSSVAIKFQSMGRGVERKDGPAPVLDGGPRSTNNYGIGHEMDKRLSAEVIMTFDSPTCAALPGSSIISMKDAHQKRICTLLAHADTLAFGAGWGGTNPATYSATTSAFDHVPSSPPMIQSVDSMLSQSSTNGLFGVSAPSSMSLGGNQSSTLLFCGACDAYTCGQLIALAEHRATVKAWLWNIDPFVITKFSIRQEREDHLSERMRQMDQVLSSRGECSRDDVGSTSLLGGVHSTTKFVLKEYADRMPRY
ncbi:hypothetical protein ACHAWU_007478 [Discostella pseudostelligera]|uniref:Glucose-6-phosphate isomerase n=1 Tax=Discostella pseudostelligera TaxID=259834 RepID=A0ABD3MR94_9STRA